LAKIVQNVRDQFSVYSCFAFQLTPRTERDFKKAIGRSEDANSQWASKQTSLSNQNSTRDATKLSLISSVFGLVGITITQIKTNSCTLKSPIFVIILLVLSVSVALY